MLYIFYSVILFYECYFISHTLDINSIFKKFAFIFSLIKSMTYFDNIEVIDNKKNTQLKSKYFNNIVF